jgi:glycyl-tRNA synthetase
MTKILKDYDMKSPVTGNDISEPIKFNLMFATSIGPTGHIKGFVHVV